jgi:UDP-2,4-diacetamido-2,4,6-trideoxy-beta-L-altropyranose hydrolase
MTECYIRADGNFDIGLGHLYRAFSLAMMLKDDFKVKLWSIEIPENLLQEFNERGIETQKIESDTDFISSVRDSIVLLDGYQFDSDYQKNLKANQNLVISVDDLHQDHFYSDIVINHAPAVSEEAYESESYTRFLLGLEYAILRPTFLECAKTVKSSFDIQDILVCLGGSDAKDLSSRVLNVLSTLDWEVTIHLVMGAAYKNEAILEMIKEDPRICSYRKLDEYAMADLMKRSDAAIVSASTILYEAIAAKCIPLAGYYTQNQFDIYSGFLSMGAIIDLGEFDHDTIENGLNQLKTGDFQLTDDYQQLIDGQSPYRIQSVIKEVYEDANIS